MALPTDFYQLMMLSVALGAGDGCFVCLCGPIAFDLLGPAGAAQGIGCLFFFMSFTMSAGSPIVGERAACMFVVECRARMWQQLV